MGNMGAALSPLVFLNLFSSFGVKASWIAVVPGIMVAILLYYFAPKQSPKKKNAPGLNEVVAALQRSSKELSKLMIIVALRSLVNTGIIMLLPLYFLAERFSHESVSYLMFATLLAGSIGGHISDKYGRKMLIVGSLFLSAIFFYGFLYTSGLLSIVLFALGGMSLMSSFSVTVAIAQDIIPENKAMASGLSLGFAIGIGGLVVSPLGKLADVYGITTALNVAFSITLIAGLLALTLKNDIKINKD